MGKSSLSIPIIWGVCLVLNTFALFNISEYQGTFVAMFWFFITVLVLIMIYASGYSKLVTALLLSFVGFCGGYFTSYLYFGVADMNAIYMGVVSAIIAVSLRFGVAVL